MDETFTNPIEVNIEHSIPISYQSANSFFHFMKKVDYLYEIIRDRKIYPRYCEEDISCFNLDIDKICIAMKCFCNIPLHLVNKHKKEYGEYCIGLSKEWGIKKGLQPVIYYNQYSDFSKILKISYEAAMKYSSNDEILSNISALLNHSFKYIKPVIGTDIKINTKKNKKDFTDEKEWRYVPWLKDSNFGEIIIEPGIIENKSLLEIYNKTIKDKNYLEFEYDDIKYLFVKTDSQRKKIIKFIDKLECPQEEKYKLISKLNVWKEVEGDF